MAEQVLGFRGIAKSRDRQKELDQQKTQLQTQLNGLIDKLEF